MSGNTWQSTGESDSGSSDKALAQLRDSVVDPSCNIYLLMLRCPVSLSGCHSLPCLLHQVSYLFQFPFPTLLCLHCDPVTPLCFFLLSLWSGDIRIRAGDSSTSACLWMLSPSLSDPSRLTCGSQCNWGLASTRIKVAIRLKQVHVFSLCCIQKWEELLCLTF